MNKIIESWKWFCCRLGRPCSRDLELWSVVDGISRGLRQLGGCDAMASPSFRKRAIIRLRDFRERLGSLSEGRLLFESTETWRTVYEEVLQACRTRRYLSVALIRSDDYWRDTPGDTSLQFNYDLVAHGFYVHRIFIIDEFFWPRSAQTPSTRLFQWIYEQRQRGVEISLTRLTDLDDEPGLVSDIGIYGKDAVGRQQTDYEGRTLRYEIAFDPGAVIEAEERWNQLLLFAEPFDELVVLK